MGCERSGLTEYDMQLGAVSLENLMDVGQEKTDVYGLRNELMDL